MDSVISRLRNTVSNVRDYLPGNPMFRDFDVGAQTGSAGPGLLWKVFDATKKSTKQAASVFLFERKCLDTLQPALSKRDKELVLEMLRKGVQTLTKLRHPKILSVHQPLEESRDSLAFATEPVLCSLANLLGWHDNLPTPVPKDVADYSLHDVERKHGLSQLCEALRFLHADVRLLHHNLSPEAVLVTRGGLWRLGCFELSCSSCAAAPNEPAYIWPGYDTDATWLAQPRLEFLAPEHLQAGTLSNASDVFALAALIVAVFGKGRTLLDAARLQGSGSHSRFGAYREFCQHQLKNARLVGLDCVAPGPVRDLVALMLSADPALRPQLAQLLASEFFNDMALTTLTFLDTLFQRSNLERSQFFKGLPALLHLFPKRVLLYYVLPCLYSEFPNASMIPFTLPAILTVANDCSTDEFCEHVLPKLREVCQLDEPPQIKLLLMQNIELLLQKAPPADVQHHFLPMVYRALESDVLPVQEICLDVLPASAHLIEFATLRNSVIARLKRLCLKTAVLKVRVQSLICIGQLMEYLDKWSVQDDILLWLSQVPSREPAVLMAMLGICQVAASHQRLGVTKETAATKVLPFLIALSVENSLNLKQFSAFMTVIHQLLDFVEQQQRSKLESLYAVEQEQRKMQQNMPAVLSRDTLLPDVASATTRKPTMMDEYMGSLRPPSGRSGAQPAVANGAVPTPASISTPASVAPLAASSATAPSPAVSALPSPAPAALRNHSAASTVDVTKKIDHNLLLLNRTPASSPARPAMPASNAPAPAWSTPAAQAPSSFSSFSAVAPTSVPPPRPALQSAASFDLSAFDSLLTSQKSSSPSMNSLQQVAATRPLVQSNAAILRPQLIGSMFPTPNAGWPTALGMAEAATNQFSALQPAPKALSKSDIDALLS